MSGVIRHLPGQPAHQCIGAGAACVDERVVVVRQPEMLDGVLQLMREFHDAHRREPENHGRPTPFEDRQDGDDRIPCEMDARLANQFRVAIFRDIRLGDDAAENRTMRRQRVYQ